MSTVRSGELLDGRYVIGEPIGEGSSGVVFHARDRWSSQKVAIKVFSDENATSSARKEFNLSHNATLDGLVRALDVGRIGQSAFVVFELAQGEHFDRAFEKADQQALIEALDDLLSAIGFIHARGLVHGDLKPENVRVGWTDSRPLLRLLDLGLARNAGEIGGGNTAYGAPETVGGAATPTSDLFSIGAMVYEVLTSGRLPFGDPEDPKYLSRLMNEEPAPLPRSVSARLAEIVNRLLHKQPSARYGSAAEVRAALRSAAQSPLLDKEIPAAPKMIERDQTVTGIQNALAQLKGNWNRSIRIWGPAHSGRSTLLKSVITEARLLGLKVFRVSARDGLNPLLNDLLDQTKRFGATQKLADAAEAVHRKVRSTDERFAALFALHQALEAVAIQEELLVAIDDYDRADDATREAIRFLSEASATGKLGWILAGDSDGSDTLSIASRPLSIDGTRSVLLAMLPGFEPTKEFVDIAHNETSGLAGHLVSGVLQLVQDGSIAYIDGRWALRAEGIPSTAFRIDLGHQLSKNLESLSTDIRRDLSAIALAGGDVETCFHQLGLDQERADRARQIGRRLRAFRLEAGRLVVASESVRDCLIAQLDDADKKEIRERVVAALKSCDHVADIERRAAHLRMLGQEQQSRAETIRAAEAALKSADLHAAARLFETAFVQGDDATRKAIGMRRVEALAAIGNADDALTALNEALEAGCNKERAASIKGQVLSRTGRYDDAISVLQELKDKECESTEDRYWLGWSLMMRGRYQEAETLAGSEARSHRDRARLGRILGTVAWHRGKPSRSCVLLEEALRHAIDEGDPLLIVEVEQSLGTAERLRSNYDAATTHYQRAISLARSRGYVPLLAKCLNNIAIVYYQTGKWPAAQQAWESMRDLASRLNAKEEILLANNNLALLFKDRGELERAEQSLDKAIELATLGGLVRYRAMALGNRAEVFVLAGRYAEAERDLLDAVRLAKEIDARDELIECRRREAALKLALGQPQIALAKAQKAANEAASMDAMVERGNALLVACAAERTLGQLEQASRDLEQAVVAFERDGTLIDRARTLLERGLIAAAKGEERAAKRAAKEASVVFAQVGADRELSLARRIEEGEQTTERAHALLGLLETAASADNVDSLLNRAIGQLLKITGAERGCVVLLEGQDLPRIAAQKCLDGADEKLPLFSRGIADRVVASGCPLVLVNVGEELELASRESVATIGLKAALCAPLKRGERALGLLYVDSRKGPELFRFGMWILDAASAIIVPALERLIEKEREAERTQLIHSVAVDALETIAAVDASLDLLNDEKDADERSRLIDDARRRVDDLSLRSQGLLELLRSDQQEVDVESETLSIDALLRFLVDRFSELDKCVLIELKHAPQFVNGQLETLATALAQVVELVNEQGDEHASIKITVEGLSERKEQALWRPGQSAGRGFVRIAFKPDNPSKRSQVDSNPVSPTNLSIKTLKRVIRRSGGRFLQDIEEGAFIVELETALKEAA